MGTADRPYSGGETAGNFQRLTPVVKALLIANLAVFFIDAVVFEGRIWNLGRFTVESAVFEGKIWEFFTFQFLHGGVFHVLVNSIGLFFFGPFLERWWGASRFLAFYLACGVAGALFYALLLFIGIFPPSTTEATPLVGASAGIYGILVGVAMIAPTMRVSLLFPPIELSMRQLAIAILAIAVGSILLQFGNEGGEAGHLGGAILGYLLVKQPRLLGWIRRSGDEVEIIRPKAFVRRSEAKLRPRSHIDLNTQNEVDRILDKISRDGLQSLTPAEREVLQRASKSHQADP